MPFHAAGGFVTAIVTESTPAMQAALRASSPPMPPDGTWSSAPCSAAARSRVSRRSSSASAPADRTISATPARSSAGPKARTASCEAASTTTSGCAASSASSPTTKDTPNCAASAFPRDASLRPTIATTSAAAQIAGPDVLETQAGDGAAADDAHPHGCSSCGGFCHNRFEPLREQSFHRQACPTRSGDARTPKMAGLPHPSPALSHKGRGSARWHF